MTAFDGLAKNQKIRATLHRDIRSICSETCHFLGLDITKPAMEVIAEMVFRKLSVYGLDLEAFAKHAKRATINSEDVKLLVRRNPSLKTHLNSIAPALGSAAKEKRRKTVPLPVSKLSETPAKANDDGNQDTRAKEDLKAIEVAKAKEDLIIAKEDARAKEEAREKEPAKETMPAEFEDMIIDDTIDLTFD